MRGPTNSCTDEPGVPQKGRGVLRSFKMKVKVETDLGGT